MINVLIHPKARKGHVEKVKKMFDEVKDVAFYDLELPVKDLPKNSKTLVIVGGDGSIREVTKKVLEGKENPLLLVVPAGSQNGVWRSLVHAGAKFSLAEILEGKTEQIPLFRPAMVNGQIFNHAAGIGQSSIRAGIEAHKLANSPLPRELAYILASFIAAAPEIRSAKKDLFKIAMTSPFLGVGNIVSNQKLHSDEIALASVHFSNFLTMVKKLKTTGSLLSSIIDVEYQPFFEMEVSHQDANYINLDGDVLPMASSTTIRIERSKKGIKLAALSL